jgi:hypothetical protein
MIAIEHDIEHLVNYSTSQTVAGSISDEVVIFLQFTYSFQLQWD